MKIGGILSSTLSADAMIVQELALRLQIFVHAGSDSYLFPNLTLALVND